VKHGAESDTFQSRMYYSRRKIEEYKKLVQDMSRVVEANEQDAIDYQFYLNSPETKCIVMDGL
jgi:hypothetical protein